MLRFSYILPAVFLTACAQTSTLTPEAQTIFDYREKIVESSEPTAMDVCPAPPSVSANIMKLADLEDYLQGREGSFENRVSSFAKDKSHSPKKSTQFTTVTCWDGGQHEVAIIGDLKNENMSWIKLVLSSYPRRNLSGHKCIYSDTPNLLTTSECPEKRSAA